MKICAQIWDSGFHGKINVARVGGKAGQLSQVPEFARTIINTTL